MFTREGVARTTPEMIDLIEGWVRDFPILSVEDGLDEEAWAGWTTLRELGCHGQGGRLQEHAPQDRCGQP